MFYQNGGKNQKHALKKKTIYLKKCTIISKENIVQKKSAAKKKIFQWSTIAFKPSNLHLAAILKKPHRSHKEVQVDCLGCLWFKLIRMQICTEY